MGPFSSSVFESEAFALVGVAYPPRWRAAPRRLLAALKFDFNGDRLRRFPWCTEVSHTTVAKR